LLRRPLAHAALITALLAAVAAVAPVPAESNRDFYQHSGRQLLIPGCMGGDCFRPLIPTVLERLPGSSIVKWKAYAVLAIVIGAVAVARFSLILGVSATGSLAALWISAFGAGALYSIFDSYTSDPLMYMLGPLMAAWLWRGRYLRAGAAGLVGVFAKEFAAAPIWIFALWAALDRRWTSATRLLLAAAAVTLVWLATHASFMAVENYSYGATASADLLHGGFLATWFRSVGVSGALMYLFTSLGALYLLVPVGFMRAGRRARLLAVAALPALAALVYVEQPERALWNFHFIVVPLAAMVLQTLPNGVVAAFVASFAVANLRFGAQLPIRGVGRIALLASLAIAAWAVVRTLTRKPAGATVEEEPVSTAGSITPARAIAIGVAQVAVFGGVVLVLFDVAVHRRQDPAVGVNQWGYRGALISGPHEGLNVSLVGGTVAFAARTPVPGTIAAQLSTEINARMKWTRNDGPRATVANLAEPGAGASTYVTMLREYAYLEPDVVCVYDGYDAANSTGVLGRNRSLVFRLTGYLPRSPAVLLMAAGADPLPEPAPDSLIRDPNAGADPTCSGASTAYCAAMADVVRFVLDRGKAVVVATPPYLSVRHERQQQSLAETLARAFGHDARFRYVDLGRAIDLGNSSQSEDGVHPTAAGAHAIASRLADPVLELARGRARIQYRAVP
jgi:hypothetical protein